MREGSTVEFLSSKNEILREEDANGIALAPGDDFWLQLRIDGKEGWIHTQKDFQAVGLPQAG